jgi:hypothetical protein
VISQTPAAPAAPAVNVPVPSPPAVNAPVPPAPAVNAPVPPAPAVNVPVPPVPAVNVPAVPTPVAPDAVAPLVPVAPTSPALPSPLAPAQAPSVVPPVRVPSVATPPLPGVRQVPAPTLSPSPAPRGGGGENTPAPSGRAIAPALPAPVAGELSPPPVRPGQRAPMPSPSGWIYFVRSGDSLWSIARLMLGQKATDAQVAGLVDRIWRLNVKRIGTGDPSLIMPGQRLLLPRT